MNPRKQKNHRVTPKLDCGCGWEGGMWRYCEAHNPCFATGQAAKRRGDKLTDAKVDAFLRRGFWSRLNWLVTGR